MALRQATIYLAAAVVCFCLAGAGQPAQRKIAKPVSGSSSTSAHSPAPTPDGAPTAGGPAIAAASLAKPGPGYQMPVGQTFVYGAVWRVFNAGTATLRMERAGSNSRVVGTADATGTVAVLYHVRDRYESFLEPATFCSHSLSKHIEEGRRRVSTDITFDYARQKTVLDQKNLVKKDGKHEERLLAGCVSDILSALYYVGSLPLQTGNSYNFPLNDGGETVTVNVHVETREQLKTPAGTFNTIRVHPEATGGLLKDKGTIWIWYSDDAARIPVQARAHMYWGTLTLTLQRIDRN